MYFSNMSANLLERQRKKRHFAARKSLFFSYVLQKTLHLEDVVFFSCLSFPHNAGAPDEVVEALAALREEECQVAEAEEEEVDIPREVAEERPAEAESVAVPVGHDEAEKPLSDSGLPR